MDFNAPNFRRHAAGGIARMINRHGQVA